MKPLICLCALLFLTSCVNKYKENYYPNTSINPASPRLIYAAGFPTLETSPEEKFWTDLHKLKEEGYINIGHSRFTDRLEPTENLRTFAQSLQAEKVLHIKVFNKTKTYTSDYSTYEPVTVYYDGSVSSGLDKVNFSGSTTEYREKVKTLSYSVDLYDHLALYMVQTQPGGFGAFCRDLNDEEKQSINSNFGVAIDLVRKGSSAFRANLMRGDIITHLDETPIEDATHLYSMIEQRYGVRDVSLSYVRNAQVRHVRFDMDPEYLNGYGGENDQYAAPIQTPAPAPSNQTEPSPMVQSDPQPTPAPVPVAVSEPVTKPAPPKANPSQKSQSLDVDLDDLFR